MENARQGYFLSIGSQLLLMGAAGFLLLSLFGVFENYRSIFALIGMGLSVLAAGFNAVISHYPCSFLNSHKEMVFSWVGFLITGTVCFFSVFSLKTVGYILAGYSVFFVCLFTFLLYQYLETNDIWDNYQNTMIHRLNTASTICLLVGFVLAGVFSWLTLIGSNMISTSFKAICIIGDVAVLFGGVCKLATIRDLIGHLDSLYVTYGVEEE